MFNRYLTRCWIRQQNKLTPMEQARRLVAVAKRLPGHLRRLMRTHARTAQRKQLAMTLIRTVKRSSVLAYTFAGFVKSG